MALCCNCISLHSGKYGPGSQTSQPKAKLEKRIKNLRGFNILLSPCFQSCGLTFFYYYFELGVGGGGISSDSWLSVGFGWIFSISTSREIFHDTVPVLPVAQVTILRLDYTRV